MPYYSSDDGTLDGSFEASFSSMKDDNNDTKKSKKTKKKKKIKKKTPDNNESDEESISGATDLTGTISKSSSASQTKKKKKKKKETLQKKPMKKKHTHLPKDVSTNSARSDDDETDDGTNTNYSRDSISCLTDNSTAVSKKTNKKKKKVSSSNPIKTKKSITAKNTRNNNKNSNKQQGSNSDSDESSSSSDDDDEATGLSISKKSRSVSPNQITKKKKKKEKSSRQHHRRDSSADGDDFTTLSRGSAKSKKKKKTNNSSSPTRIATISQTRSVRSVSADHLDLMTKKKKKNNNNNIDGRGGGRGGRGRGRGHSSGGGRTHSGGRSLHGERRPGRDGRSRGRGLPEKRSVKRHTSLPIRGSASNFTPLRYLKKQLSRDHDIASDADDDGINSSNNDNDNKKSSLRRRKSKDTMPNEHVELLEGLADTDNADDDDATTNTTSRKRSARRRSSSADGIKGRPRGARERLRKKSSLSPTRLSAIDETKPRGILRKLSDSDDETFQPLPNRSNSNGRRHSVGFSGSDVDDEFFDEEIVPINFADDDGSLNNNNNNTNTKNNTNKKKGNNNISSKPSFKKSIEEGSFLGFSNHSYMSTRTQMSIDAVEFFDDDPPWKKTLRHMRLLAPHKGETVLKRNIRIFTWTAMTLDFIAALVAVIQYSGATECCGEPMFNIIMPINWDKLYRVVTALYLCLLFAEIIPVIKNGMPYNVVNPMIGFLITIGMFFDDSIMEAVVMWIIEALAIFFEFLVYRVNARIFRETNDKLKQTDQDLIDMKKSRRNFFEMSRHNSKHSRGTSRLNANRKSNIDVEMNTTGRSRSRNRPPQRYHSNIQCPHDSDDDDSISGHSFGDSDSDDGHSLSTTFKPSEHAAAPIPRPNLPRPATTKLSAQIMSSRRTYAGSNTSFSVASSRGRTSVIPGERRQNRLLRQRRILREKVKEQEKDLYYHFVGTILNVSLAAFAMILIISFASTGGLCFHDDTLEIFARDQIGKCGGCENVQGVCEICPETGDEGNKCYYPYYN